jgi:hypothetical protein
VVVIKIGWEEWIVLNGKKNILRLYIHFALVKDLMCMDVVMYSSTWTFIISMCIAKTSHDSHYLLSFICFHNNLKVKYIDTCDGFRDWMQLCIYMHWCIAPTSTSLWLIVVSCIPQKNQQFCEVSRCDFSLNCNQILLKRMME